MNIEIGMESIKPSDISKIRTSLERIQKALVSKLKNGDEQFVTNELKWVDEKINALFNLKDKDFAKFKILIDPKDRYKFVEPIDFSNIDWSQVKVVRGNLSADAADESIKDVRLYNLDYFEPIEYDLLDSFLSFCIRIWSVAAQADSFETSRRALFIIGNLYSNISLRTDARLDFGKLYGSFIKKLTFQCQQLLLKKYYTPDNNALIRYLSFQFHISHFLKENFNILNAGELRGGIFESLKAAIDNEQVHIVKNFVRDLNGSIVPSPTNAYSDLYSLVDRRFHELTITNNELLKKIPEYGHWRPYYVFTSEEYDNVILGLDDLIVSLTQLIPDQESINVIVGHIGDLKKYVLKRYKYRLIQKTLITVLTYAIFKKEYELVDFAFEYNQPPDSAATWSNKDTVPVELPEIISTIALKYSIDNDLVFNMPDHHGALGYIDLFFLKALLNWRVKKRDNYTQELSTLLNSYADRYEMKSNPGALEGIINTLKDLKARVTPLFNRSRYPFEKVDVAVKDQLIKLIDDIIDGLKAGLDRIESKEKIAAERIQNFRNNILDRFNKRAFFRKLIERQAPEANVTDAATTPGLEYTIGFNELVDRSMLIENWHIPTYGVIEFIGNQLAEQEDFNIEREIDRRFGRKNKIKDTDVENTIKSIQTNQIAIVKNHFIEGYLAKNSNFVPHWKTEEFKNDDLVIGTFKDSLIFGYRAFGLHKIVITPSNLGNIFPLKSDKYGGYEEVKGLYVRIIDLGTDNAERKKFATEPPKWLEDEHKELAERDAFLSKKLWIRIYGTFKWILPPDFTGRQFLIMEE